MSLKDRLPEHGAMGFQMMALLLCRSVGYNYKIEVEACSKARA